MKHNPCPCRIYAWKNKGLYIYISSYFLNIKYYVIKGKFENVFHSIPLSLSFPLTQFVVILVPGTGMEPQFLQWELRVLTLDCQEIATYFCIKHSNISEVTFILYLHFFLNGLDSFLTLLIQGDNLGNTGSILGRNFKLLQLLFFNHKLCILLFPSFPSPIIGNSSGSLHLYLLNTFNTIHFSLSPLILL